MGESAYGKKLLKGPLQMLKSQQGPNLAQESLGYLMLLQKVQEDMSAWTSAQVQMQILTKGE